MISTDLLAKINHHTTFVSRYYVQNSIFNKRAEQQKLKADSQHLYESFTKLRHCIYHIWKLVQ
jgi:hypothetical protein